MSVIVEIFKGGRFITFYDRTAGSGSIEVKNLGILPTHTDFLIRTSVGY